PSASPWPPRTPRGSASGSPAPGRRSCRRRRSAWSCRSPGPCRHSPPRSGPARPWSPAPRPRGPARRRARRAPRRRRRAPPSGFEPSIHPPRGRRLLRPLEGDLTEDLVDVLGADLLSGLQLPHRLVDLALLAHELLAPRGAGLAAELRV